MNRPNERPNRQRMLVWLLACSWLVTCDSQPTAQPPTPAPVAVPASTGTAPSAVAYPAPAITPSATPRSIDLTERILFARKGTLWTTDLSGGDLVQLVPPGFMGSSPFEGFARAFVPRVSPDGRYLVTLTDGRGAWLLSSDGREQPRYLDEYAYPSWSPDSGALTYTQRDSVYVRLLNTWDEPRPIARLESRSVAYAEWSPDGKRIAFLAYESSTATPSGAHQQLWLVRPDGTQLHMLESIDALGRERGPREVQWGDGGRMLLAADSQPWIIAPPPERQFAYPVPLPHEPPRVQLLSPAQPFGMGKVDGIRTFGITFRELARAVELRQCGIFAVRWSPDGARLLCTPGMDGRMSVEIFDAQRDFANWTQVFDLPGPDDIFFTPHGDELVFETRLEDEDEPVIWRARIDPLSKAKRVGRGMLLAVFRRG